MKKLPLFISLLFVLTCAKEDSQNPNTPPSQIVKQYTLTATAGDGGSVSTAGGTFASGTQVSLTANPITFKLNSDTDITATFITRND